MTDDGSASYLAPMRRWLFVFVLASPALPAVASAAAGRPPWLERAARLAAARLSDGTVPTSITYLAPRSRFPRVVLTGSFVCNACSRPSNATPAPRGTIAELRFDGDTQRFVERWRPRAYERGRWVRLPTQTHTWRLLETNDDWKVAINSSGDPAPQLPKRSR